MEEAGGGDVDGGAAEAEEDEGAFLMRLSGEWLVAKVVCILTIIKCFFFLKEKRIQEEEDGEKRERYG